MRTVLLSDIHANLVALQSALVEIDHERPDQIVCLGDTAVSGPQPHETLERLIELDCQVVMGNTDAWLLTPEPFSGNDPFYRMIDEIDHWCRQQLTPGDFEFLRTFQSTLKISLGDGVELLCYHGTPGSYNEVLLATTPEDELATRLAGQTALVLAGGHTHVQMVRRYQGSFVLNPGSIGLPYERSADGKTRNVPWAEWALIDYDRDRLRVELRRTPVDRADIQNAALWSNMPYARWWASEWGA